MQGKIIMLKESQGKHSPGPSYNLKFKDTRVGSAVRKKIHFFYKQIMLFFVLFCFSDEKG